VTAPPDRGAGAPAPAPPPALHKALRTLADNPSVGPELQAMAKDVLSGRVGMRDMVQSDRYLGAIGERLSQMREAAENMTPDERRQSEARAQKMRDDEEAAERERSGERRRDR